MKEWFIVKDKNQYLIKKSSIIKDEIIEFGTKIFKVYQRLGDAKVGLENVCKEKIQALKKQEELFNELQRLNKKDNESKGLDYEFLNAEAERLKKKWGIC